MLSEFEGGIFLQFVFFIYDWCYIVLQYFVVGGVKLQVTLEFIWKDHILKKTALCLSGGIVFQIRNTYFIINVTQYVGSIS